MPPPSVIIFGRTDAVVETIAGAPEPGDADGMGRDARFDGPSGIALDKGGAAYIADTRNSRIRVVDEAGKTRTLSGSAPGYQDGPVAYALFNGPSGVAVSPDGGVYVADTNNDRIRLIRNGVVTTVAGDGPGFTDGPANRARFDHPTGLCWQSERGTSGVLLIADSGNHRVRRMRFAGLSTTVETLRTVTSTPTSVSSAGGDTVVATPDAGTLNLNGRAVPKVNVALPSDAPANTPIDAISLRRPVGVCVTREGWYVIDTRQGAVFIVKNGSAQVMAGASQVGAVRRGFRDGPGNRAGFGWLTSVATDAKGRVYVADCGNNAIRRITLPANEQP